jgi:hypothetical protein
MWLIKILFAVMAVAVVVASVAVVWQMTNRSKATAPTADARPGDCLTWPTGDTQRAARVDCTDDHLFEVAGSGPAPAAQAEQQQTCARAVADYLGPRYDPGGRFVIGAMPITGRLVCGLQLPSDGAASFAFKGKIADQDQSRVWATGTCLGIRDGKTTDIAVDCGLPHALEITGMADLSAVFGQAAPSTAAQDAVVWDACGRATSAYLSPLTLDATGLSLRYQPIDPKGWAAGSRRIACRIGSPTPDGGWTPLVRSARDGVNVDVPQPAAPPSPVEPAPAEVAAPSNELPEASPPDEEPAPVDHETEAPTAVEADAEPHLDGSAVPGPVPHLAGSAVPGPATESPVAAPLPDSGTTP